MRDNHLPSQSSSSNMASSQQHTSDNSPLSCKWELLILLRKYNILILLITCKILFIATLSKKNNGVSIPKYNKGLYMNSSSLKG